MEKQERNYGIDLVKIVAMLMIVTLHVLGCGGVLGASVGNPKNCAVAWLLEIAAFGAVNIYAMASGYLCVSSGHKYKSILLLWLQVFFYTAIITALFYVNNPGTVGKQQIINAVFPVTTTQYWYFTGYFCMFFFIPVMNTALEHLEKRQLQRILAAAFVLFSILPTIFALDPFHENDGYSALWLAVLYMVGGYIRKYGLFEKVPSAVLGLSYLVLVVITWAIKWKKEETAISFGGLVSYLSPTIVLAAICIFLVFSRIKVKRLKKSIKWIASATFGVYLIHTHPLIWNYILIGRFSDCASAGLTRMGIGVIAAVFLIFAGCTVIDSIRKLLFMGVSYAVNYFTKNLHGNKEMS